jgi:archaellin
MQVNPSVQAHRGLVGRRARVLWASLALLVVAAAIAALLLFAGGIDQAQSAPTGSQPTQVSVPDRQVPRLGHPVAE